MTVRQVVAFGALGVLGCAACGDNVPPGDDPFTAVSGSRLTLQKYRYDDGTEQTVTNEFYDVELHTRCAPRRWSDGAIRCLPIADDVEYVDPACTMLVGLGRTIAKPTHFIASDAQIGGSAAVRVFQAGAARDPITQYYGIVNGACAGPTPVPVGLMSFFEVGDELAGDALVAFHDDEIDGGRLGLQVRETDDGLRVPSGLHDRELDTTCVATLHGDGSVVCEPIVAAAAIYFGDSSCSEPAMAVGAAAIPAIARVVEPSGCASYHRAGRELSPPIYRREGSGCNQVTVPTGERLFSIEAPIELPTLGRSLEDVAGRRLQRVILDHGGLRMLDDRLFDTAAGIDCKPRALRDTVRCLPANLVAATTLFTEGCAVQVRVAEVPQRACERLAYATANRPFQVREIGEVVSDALFRLDGTACQRYSGPPGTELRAIGPSLDLTTFMTAIYFGERSP